MKLIEGLVWVKGGGLLSRYRSGRRKAQVQGTNGVLGVSVDVMAWQSAVCGVEAAWEWGQVALDQSINSNAQMS